MLINDTLKQKKKSFSFKPDFISTSIEAIDFGYLRSRGITTCFIDLDGTVVSRGKFEVEPTVSKALKSSGFKIIIATNRSERKSLQTLKASLHAIGVAHPVGIFGKPSKKYMSSALKRFHLKPEQAVMIGDRYVQDILGANRSGVYSLLVHKKGDSHDLADALISLAEYKRTYRLSRTYKPAAK